ncbi:MAG TPA: polysaccharide deacetylase family protein [Polyangiales bacterium]|nr:polysaccharide deacetylase family protein [Polyangiales bacterium]
MSKIIVYAQVAGLSAAFSCNTSFPAASAVHLEGDVTCAPLRGPAAVAPKAEQVDPNCTEMADAEDAGVEGFTGMHARGFGYPVGTEELPDHKAYLTFDDGPSDWTNEFLDVLQRYSVRATFFVTSEQLKGAVGLRGSYVDGRGVTQVYERLVKRIVDEGHVLGNHTLNHPDLGAMRDQQVTSEFDQNELQVNAALMRTGGQPYVMSLLRPPYGSPWFTGPSETVAPIGAQKQVAERIARHGLNVLWNLDSTDSQEWALEESYSRTVHEEPSSGAPNFRAKTQRIKDTILTSPVVMRGGGIVVLMHDTHPTTLSALPDMIQGLRDMGYTFETVEEYVQERWQRASMELTPGPPRNNACIAQRDWGCLTSKQAEVCGRMWRAYAAVGGEARLGGALSAQGRDAATGIVSQAFERGVLELHPENAAPCNVVIRGEP